ncbi:hypothetical protein, partial [Vibrio sp. 10N.222.55.A1]|uniref:hypothetical protein n=1 Tax=Vibrio sp. 10N.222.55.A1 TaxID=3229646 RepID=UPI00355009C4
MWIRKFSYIVGTLGIKKVRQVEGFETEFNPSLAHFGAEVSLPHTVLSFKLTLRASGIPAFSWRYYLLSG